MLAEVVPPVGWWRFLAACVSPRRLTEPPRTCGVGGREALLREMQPLPRIASPEERLAFEGLDACGGGSACEVGRFSYEMEFDIVLNSLTATRFSL